ncbi:hypothetical protein [Sodalis ligni]|uniref:Lipoprotein n=1 Tax=Sodalis ligni TaxID=2697027 RepID=A0A4R1N5X8_9GAMM|nr:hypothetical protein [Sodalis ligni]TCL02604.1 hypothetical protein EZJ58_0628 [Sodalis ligni]
MRSFQLGNFAITTVIACSLSGCAYRGNQPTGPNITALAITLHLEKDESYKSNEQWKGLMAMMKLDHDVAPASGDYALFEWANVKTTGNEDQDYLKIVTATPGNSMWAYTFYHQSSHDLLNKIINENTYPNDIHRIGPWVEVMDIFLNTLAKPGEVDRIYNDYSRDRQKMGLITVSEKIFKNNLSYAAENRDTFGQIYMNIFEQKANVVDPNEQYIMKNIRVRIEIHPTNKIEKAIQNQLNKLPFNEDVLYSKEGKYQGALSLKLGIHSANYTEDEIVRMIDTSLARCHSIAERTYNPKAEELCGQEIIQTIPKWVNEAGIYLP